MHKIQSMTLYFNKTWILLSTNWKVELNNHNNFIVIGK